MALLTRTTWEGRQAWTRYSRENPRGSGYCEEQGVHLVRVTDWHLLGRRVWRRVEVIGEVPAHDWIRRATLGG